MLFSSRNCKRFDRYSVALAGLSIPRFRHSFFSLLLLSSALLFASAFQSAIRTHGCSGPSIRTKRTLLNSRGVRMRLSLSDDWQPGDNRNVNSEINLSNHSSFDNLPVVDRSDYQTEWGVTHEDYVQEFPHTAEEVVDQAFDAIAGTIHNQKKMDPNVASNARSSSIFTHRPVRKQCDAGRIGLEIDGAEFLFPEESPVSPGRAIRRVALMLAAKLSLKESWEEEEYEQNVVRASRDRPVVVCFNTIKQALVACQELKKMKEEDLSRAYDNIRIQCLSDGIPLEMRIDRNERRRYGGLSDGYVSVARGLFMIVQPTDYNAEYLPPGPAVGAINNFQKIVAQASIEELPTIALSPRFLSNDTPLGGGWDQSGYQKSAIYGGIEPPKGPTPWIMRDFTPPVYCWIGNAFTLGQPPRMDQEQSQCHLSRVLLTQSVMDEGHSWHIFAAKECAHDRRKAPTSFVYLASTRSASGRPNRDLIGKILDGI